MQHMGKQDMCNNYCHQTLFIRRNYYTVKNKEVKSLDNSFKAFDAHIIF